MKRKTADRTETHGVAIRCYTLRLYGNPGKVKETLGGMLEYRAWLWDYVRRYYDKSEDATESTKGKGWIANQAFRRARGMLKAGRNSSIITGDWFNCPKRLPLLCDGTLEESKDSSWDYWVKVTNGPRLPAQTHRALKNALRRGGKLVKTCEIRQAKQGWLYARVFVEHEVPEKIDSQDYLGVDVGVNAGVARSDGYVAKSLRPVLGRTRQKRAEQQRQGHQKSSDRSACKQFLNREAKRIVTLAVRGDKVVVLERLKTLANLRMTGSVGQWAPVHLGQRVHEFAELQGVPVVEVWPAGTSITCRACGYADKKNRSGADFKCRQCATRGHADLIAACNLADKARGVFPAGRREGREYKHETLF
ncbi:MAG: transposase [Candidatus Uhrbacteria bacterium]|nr:transposase [Candidatus Uhrbacteria bacterium]